MDELASTMSLKTGCETHETPEKATAARRKPLKHYDALDGMRGCAILAVMLFHAKLPIFKGGFIGVDVFFVLSGFLITSILLREWEGSGKIALRHFYARRLLRLAPALIVLVGITVLLRHHLSMGFGMPTINAAALVLLYVSNWVRAFSENLFILGFLGHTWSLAIEEQFYFLWPPVLAFLLCRKVRPSMLAVGLAIAASISVCLRWVLLAISTAGLIAAIVTGTHIPMILSILTSHWLTWLGRISYSVYLFHILAFVLLAPRVPRLFDFKFTIYWLGNYWHTLAIDSGVFVSIASAIALGAASYYFVERPFLMLKKRFSPRDSALAAS